MAFIDLSKAFGTISREMIWWILEKNGGPSKFLAIHCLLHSGMQAHVRYGNLLEPPPAAVGVKQGCVSARVLSNLYLAAVNFITHSAIKGIRE